MDCNFLGKISLLVDDKLSRSETKEIKNHVAGCEECRQAEKSFLALRERIKSIQFKRDAAAERMVLSKILQTGKTPRRKPNRLVAPSRPAMAASALLLVILAGIFLYTRLPQKSWKVTGIDGTPKIGAKNLSESGRLKIGEWLETDAVSRAKIAVANIAVASACARNRISLSVKLHAEI